MKVFIKSTGVVAPGNPKLLRMGGIPFPAEPWENLRAIFTPPEQKNGQLFSSAAQQPPPMEERTDVIVQGVNDTLPSGEAIVDAGLPRFSEIVKPPEVTAAIATAGQSCDAYSLVIEQMLGLLEEPRTAKWLADKMQVCAPQIKDWLARGIREGRIAKSNKPAGYIALSPTLFHK